MLIPEIQYELDQCAAACRRYGILSGKAEDQVIAKQGGKLAFNIYRGMRKLMPKKGSIRLERMAALKGGHGVKVRDAVYNELAAKYNLTTQMSTGKTFLTQRHVTKKKGWEVVSSTRIDGLNFQALAVERELAVRESGRGFAAFATPRPARRDYQDEVVARSEKDIMSRYGFLLSEFQLMVGEGVETKYALFRWKGAANGSYTTATPGLTKEKQQRVLLTALRETTADIRDYVPSVMREVARECGLE